MPTSKAQLRANKKYKRKHRKQTLYHSYKSTTKNFILHIATKNDIINLIPKWIRVRKCLERSNNS